MQDRPTRTELLATVASFFEDELLPALAARSAAENSEAARSAAENSEPARSGAADSDSGPLAYRSRVAANLVRILQREQTLGDAALQRERGALCALLDTDPRAAGSGTLAEQLAEHVAELNRQLVVALDAGRIEHARAWPALMAITRDKLAIIRPGYDAFDAQAELP